MWPEPYRFKKMNAIDLIKILEQHVKGSESFQEEDIMRFRNLINLEKPSKEVTGSRLENAVHSLEDRQTMLESRLDSLEFQNNIMPLKDKIEKVESFIEKLFNENENITNVSYSPSKEGLTIKIIHNFEDTIDAIKETQKYISKLEEAFPGIYFEPWILHTSEVRPEHLEKSKTLIQR
ncbi:MAG: hypothetical protein GWN01_08985 [Nitrosopumilaceae archaeon]|nr:hypothetical protein [Nitrosopumilaceae archaeon]NIU01043.1 hypothetical protein [Nitrosopumilaceae archaeon]NIU87477.1 hypothetical protein [Nitrosopumilaceae archaeon]NIV65527.1 hypothetical protein [Nitrosopumilaceae archaeon]NIX61645.1 hypothetical protein [Nitrosopumilaceae archaeon]